MGALAETRNVVDWRRRLGDLDAAMPAIRFVRLGIGVLQDGLSLSDPKNTDDYLPLLRRLYAAGRKDLALGRLFEGHIDALQIIHRYGDRQTVSDVVRLTQNGACFGVWNAYLPDEPLTICVGALAGGKAFASGAGILSHALVTATPEDGEPAQLLLIDLERTPPDIDVNWWRVLGMQRSESHIVRWRGAEIARNCFIGAPGDYEREPWFSAGALRFVAVQAGSVAALFDHTQKDLARAQRANHPQQSRRLAELYGLADAAAGCVERAADRLFDKTGIDEKLAIVANARASVAQYAEDAIAIVQQSIGVRALFDNHPAQQTIADLMVYLRQPGPDAQIERVGAAAAAGLISPEL